MIRPICWMVVMVVVREGGGQLCCPGAKPNSGELLESLRPNTQLILPPPASRMAGSATGAQGPSKIAHQRGQRSNPQRDLVALEPRRAAALHEKVAASLQLEAVGRLSRKQGNRARVLRSWRRAPSHHLVYSLSLEAKMFLWFSRVSLIKH